MYTIYIYIYMYMYVYRYRVTREEQAQMDAEWNDFLAFAQERLELRPTGMSIYTVYECVYINRLLYVCVYALDTIRSLLTLY